MTVQIGDRINALDEEKELIVVALRMEEAGTTDFIAKYSNPIGNLPNGESLFWRRGFRLKDETVLWEKGERTRSAKEESLIQDLTKRMNGKEAYLINKITKEKETIGIIHKMLQQDSLESEISLLNNPNVPRELSDEMILITQKVAERFIHEGHSGYLNYRIYHAKKIELVFSYSGVNSEIAVIDIQKRTIETNAINWAQALTSNVFIDGEDSKTLRIISSECYDAFKRVVQFLQGNGFAYKEEGFNPKSYFALKTQFRWEENHINEMSKKQMKHARKPNQPTEDVANHYYRDIGEFNLTNFLYLTNIMNKKTIQFFERRLTHEEMVELKVCLNRIAADTNLERRPERGTFKTNHDEVAIYHVETNTTIDFFDNGQVVVTNHSPSNSDPIEKRIPILNLMWEYKFWKWFNALSLATYNDEIN